MRRAVASAALVLALVGCTQHALQVPTACPHTHGAPTMHPEPGWGWVHGRWYDQRGRFVGRGPRPVGPAYGPAC